MSRLLAPVSTTISPSTHLPVGAFRDHPAVEALAVEERVPTLFALLEAHRIVALTPRRRIGRGGESGADADDEQKRAMRDCGRMRGTSVSIDAAFSSGRTLLRSRDTVPRHFRLPGEPTWPPSSARTAPRPSFFSYLKSRAIDVYPAGALRWWLLALVVLAWTIEQFENLKMGPVLVYMLDEFDVVDQAVRVRARDRVGLLRARLVRPLAPGGPLRPPADADLAGRALRGGLGRGGARAQLRRSSASARSAARCWSPA